MQEVTLSSRLVPELELAAALAELAAHRIALEAAELRAEAACMVTQLLGGVVESDELTVVASDVVECWLRLAPAVRSAYVGHRGETAVQMFAADYTVAVDRSWRSSVEDDDLPSDVVDRLCVLSWRAHVACVRRRQILGAPPAPAWLACFPLPDDLV